MRICTYTMHRMDMIYVNVYSFDMRYIYGRNTLMYVRMFVLVGTRTKNLYVCAYVTYTFSVKQIITNL